MIRPILLTAICLLAFAKVTLAIDPTAEELAGILTGDAMVDRGGSVYLNTFRGVSKWMSRPFYAAAGIGVARLMYAWSGGIPPSDECGLLPL